MRWTVAFLTCACLGLSACGGASTTDDTADTVEPAGSTSAPPAAPQQLSSEDIAQFAEQQAALAECMAEQGYELQGFGGPPRAGDAGGPRPSEFDGAPPTEFARGPRPSDRPTVPAPGQDEGFGQAMQACFDELGVDGGFPGGAPPPPTQE